METAFKDCDHYLCLLIMYLLPTFVWKTEAGKYQHRIIPVQPWKYTGSVEVSGQPDSLATIKTALSTHWTGGWLDAVASLDVPEDKKISCPCQKSNPQIVK